MRHVLSEGSSRDLDIGNMIMTESRVGVNNILDGSAGDINSVRELMAPRRQNLEYTKEQAD